MRDGAADGGPAHLRVSRFYPTDYAHGRDFTADLDAFLGKLPAGWRYGVELRNRHWLQPEYFAMLRRHGVAHVFNSWDAFLAARFLLKAGRKYEEAVKEFSPYKAVKEVNAEARRAGAELVKQARQKSKQAFICEQPTGGECAGDDWRDGAG